MSFQNRIYFSLRVLNQQPLFITKISQAPVGIRAQVATMKWAYLWGRIPSQLCGSYGHVTVANNNYLCGTKEDENVEADSGEGRQSGLGRETKRIQPLHFCGRELTDGKVRTPWWL